jgi:hypothetical protein
MPGWRLKTKKSWEVFSQDFLDILMLLHLYEIEQGQRLSTII